jgi:hypothetical protein
MSSLTRLAHLPKMLWSSRNSLQESFLTGTVFVTFFLFNSFISLADNRNDMRLHMDNEEGEEISNVNFHDESFYNHWR